jgi:hypothetical protein
MVQPIQAKPQTKSPLVFNILLTLLTLCPLKRGRFFKTCLKGIVKYPPRRSKQLSIKMLQLRLLVPILWLWESITKPIRYAQHPAITCSFSRAHK